MDDEKLHIREFQLTGIGGKNEMQVECSKHLRHIAIEKYIFSELKRCIFQISLKYIKLVIPKILVIPSL